jgi:hypothetical protein
MIEREFKTIHDVELLIRWMQTPPGVDKPEMPPGVVELLDRLQQALRWLNQHGSVRKVWPMMYEHYKHLGTAKYSEATARRDVADAQRVFNTLDSHNPKFYCSLMIDLLMESVLSAKGAHKYGEAARLSKVLHDWVILAIKLGIEDASALTNPVTLIATSDPKDSGFEPNPNVIEEVEQFIRRKKAEKEKELTRSRLTDANYTEETDAGGAPNGDA